MSRKVSKNVPELRFPEYEEPWNVNKIKDYYSISSGATPLRSNNSYFKNATIPWVKTTDLNNSKIFTTEEFISEVALRETSARKNPIGTILVAMYGGFNQIGRTGLLKIEAATNQAISVLTPHPEVSPYFLIHFLNRNVHMWRRFAASSRKDPNITGKDVGDFPLIFPTKNEQEKIANFLGAVDARLGQLRRKHELLQTYKRGVMQQLFSQQIRFKQDDGSDFPDWEEKKLGELGEFKNGFNANKEAFGSGFDFVNLMDIFGKNEINNEQLGKVQISEDQIEEYKIKKGDVLFVRSSVKREGVGQSCLINNDFKDTVYSGFIIRFRETGSTLEHLYKKYCFSSPLFRSQVLAFATSSANTNINQDSLSQLRLTYPCREEQRKIVNFLDLIEQKVNIVDDILGHTELFKQALLQKMFV